MTVELMPGQIFHVGAACGVPHGFRPIHLRLIRVLPWTSWEGMSWLDGYELGPDGLAVERRTVYVITAGLQLVAEPDTRPLARAVRAHRRNQQPAAARVPRQRRSPEPTTRRRN